MVLSLAVNPLTRQSAYLTATTEVIERRQP